MHKEIRIRAALKKSLNQLTKKELINLIIETEAIVRTSTTATDSNRKTIALLNEKFTEDIPGYVIIEF